MIWNGVKIMTLEQAKQEFNVLNVLVKKLVDLSDEQRQRAINVLLTMYASESGDMKKEIETISFCVKKLDTIGKSEGQAIVKFLVDRFIPNRFEKCEEEMNIENVG